MASRRGKTLLVAGVVALAVGGVALANPLAARADTTTLTPNKITTKSGSTGRDQPVSNLAVKDLSGTTDGWNRYVEFKGRYSGYPTYTVPDRMPVASISGAQVQVNYRGPATQTQTWTFQLYDWSAGGWATVGTNASAPDWGAWKLLTFNVTGTLAGYVSPTRAMWLRLVANNSRDAADIDYAAIVVSTGGSQPPITAAPSPTAPPVVTPTTATPTSSGSSQSADTVAPSAPTNVRVTGTTSSSVSLSWSASTDNVGVTGYEVFQGSGTSPVASATTTSASIAGLSASTPSSFTVKARDAAGNRSAPSVSVTATTAASGGQSATVPCPSCWHPPLRLSWNWVLSVVPSPPYRNVQMYDIDGFDATAADVAALHSAGKKVVCYISVGTYEEWRPDAGQFPAVVLGRNLDDWPGERWLDVRNVQQANSALAAIMNARLDMCKNKGFDAVEFDNMDGYDNNNTGFPLTASHQAYYNIFLANGAHTRGMSAVMKNDVAQITTLEPYFDMALNEECHQFNECGGYRQFVQAGKPVFNAEYGSSTSFCAADNADNYNGVRFSDSLDDSVFEPCR